MIWVGSRLKCNLRQVEGSKYFQEKLEVAEKYWATTKRIYEHENQGVVVLAFKTRTCAA